ncbi:MAG: translocation/assembly module TamB domain-containing protein [Proteobacteria bacterium]|nr:translocation/assembly module TamB domain-containing protein [Pseudomonadota bacterium]
MADVDPTPADPATAVVPPVVPPPLPPGKPRVLWHLLQPVLLVALLLAVVVAALAGAAAWLLRSEDGSRWLLARVPGVELQGLQGALLSERFAAERLAIRWGGGQQSITIDGLRAEGVHWRWHPAPGAWLGLQAASLQARRIDVQTGPPSPQPPKLPPTLDAPLRVQIDRLQVAELQIDQLAPLRKVDGRELRLWEPGGREYELRALSLDWERAHLEGALALGAHPPFTLQVQAQVRVATDAGGPPWSAELRATGPLARFDFNGTLRGQPARAGAAPPALDVEAQITPLDPWPLARLRLRTQALDLSALSAAAPRTAVSGRVDIDSRSLDGPFGAAIELDNASPGRWNEGRVPVRRLQARLRSPDADRRRLLIEDFDLQLARGSDSAGRWRGNGQWLGNKLQVDSRIDDLRPQLLDSRAATMQLSGPLNFIVHGLPAPSAGVSAASAASAAAPATSTAAAAFNPRALTLDLKTTLEGQITGSPHPVKVAIDGSADLQRVNLRELRAEAGAAQAVLALQAQRVAGGSGAGSWQLRSNGRLADFDPLPWWPGEEASAWRAGKHRLSGNWSLDVTLPPLKPGVTPLALAQGTVGSGKLQIDRSLLAGVPLALTLELGHRSGGDTPSTVVGELNLGGNRLQLEGRGNPLGDGRADQVHLDLQAGQLAALAPLARLDPELAAWVPRAGQAQASLDIQGRWPKARSNGKARLQGLQLGTLQARNVQADWRLDTAADQPLLLQAELQGLVSGKQQVERLQVDLRGTGRQHRLELTAALPQGPPPGLDTVLGLRTAAGTLAQLRADGGWTADSGGGGRWAGRVEQLTLGPWGGAGGGAAPTGPGTAWLDARDLRAEVRFDAADGLAEIQADAGALRLAEATTLRWDEVRVDLRGAHPAFALRAELEPFELAPLLARAQPTMGWQGDLRLAGKAELRVGDKVDADIVFERRGGDLRVTEDSVSTSLGLSELRAVASAHDGLWQIAAGFAGQSLGQASARLNLRPRPEQRWPTADTPIDGLIQGHVANLGVWSTWVPPGWRLSGALSTSASVTGRVGDPDYAGEISASNVAVRNLLLGVDLRQGEALIRLKGANAEIERFTLHGGDGTVNVSGNARLADKPDTRLQLRADRFRVLGRVDRQLIVSGALDVALTENLIRLDGKLHVDEGLFDVSRSDAPSLDDDVIIRQAGPAPAQAQAAPPPRPRRSQQVAVEVDLGEQLRVRGRGLDGKLSGKLRLGSANNKLTLNGIVSAAGGTYAAYGQKLEIERGMVVFSGDMENPALDVLALRPNLDVEVGVAITGSANAPRVRLYSSPEMSDTDKLSWLVLGRASDGLGRADTALLQRAAVALLAGDGEAPTDALIRNLGLDTLSVRQSDTDVRETVITLGKQLSRRWYVGYERGINATAGTFQLIYRIAQRFTLRAQSGAENSLDLIWVWRIEGDGPAKPAEQAPVPKSAASAPP